MTFHSQINYTYIRAMSSSHGTHRKNKGHIKARCENENEILVLHHQLTFNISTLSFLKCRFLYLSQIIVISGKKPLPIIASCKKINYPYQKPSPFSILLRIQNTFKSFNLVSPESNLYINAVLGLTLSLFIKINMIWHIPLYSESEDF